MKKGEETFKGILRIQHTYGSYDVGDYVSDYKNICVWNNRDRLSAWLHLPIVILCEVIIADTKCVRPLMVEDYEKILQRYGTEVNNIKGKELTVRFTKVKSIPSYRDVVMLYENGELMSIDSFENGYYGVNPNDTLINIPTIKVKREDFKIITSADEVEFFELVDDKTLDFYYQYSITINNHSHEISLYTNIKLNTNDNPLANFNNSNAELLLKYGENLFINNTLARAILRGTRTLNNVINKTDRIYCFSEELKSLLRAEYKIDVRLMKVTPNIQQVECDGNIIIFNGDKKVSDNSNIFWLAEEYSIFDVLLHCAAYDMPVHGVDNLYTF